MPVLLQLAQSYSNPDSVNYKIAYLREQIREQIGDAEFGKLAFEDQVQLAMLGETIIVGGFLRTELIRAKSISAEHLNVDDLAAISGNFSGLMAGDPDGAHLYLTEEEDIAYMYVTSADGRGFVALQSINFSAHGDSAGALILAHDLTRKFVLAYNPMADGSILISEGSNGIIIAAYDRAALQVMPYMFIGFLTDTIDFAKPVEMYDDLTVDGTVSIGTNSPKDIFEIVGSGDSTFRFHSNYAHIQLKNRSASRWWSLSPRSSGDFDIATATSDPGSGYIGTGGNALSIKANGDLIASGSKSAVVDTENYGKRRLYAVEAPDVRFMDVMEITLTPGEHWIDVEPIFSETITHYSVYPLVLEGGLVKVLEKEPNRFKVEVLGDGSVLVAFWIYGKRKDYEDVYMEEFDAEGS